MSGSELGVGLATVVEQSTNTRCETFRAGVDFPAGVNSNTDFGVPPWEACVQKPMFVIERSSTMVRSIARSISAVALACLPALILSLSAAPMCGNGGCIGDDLSAPPPAIVISLP